MAEKDIEQIKESIYQALINDNQDLDPHITELKQALREAGEAHAVFDPARLAQNNRQGRKTMKSYFKRRGVNVVFDEA